MKYQFCLKCNKRYKVKGGGRYWENECPVCHGDLADCWDLVRLHIEKLNGLCDDCENRFICYTV